jgi:dienelactone hydrolase
MRKQIFISLNCLMLLCLSFSTSLAQQVFKTTSTSVIGYLEYLPQDYNTNTNKYPIVIFLHGLGERGANSTDPATLQTTIQNVAKLGPPMYVKSGTQFPFILISPQLKNNYGDWPSNYVKEVIDYVKTYLRIDERRIYLTGLSLGGGGTWWTAQDYPELFAAIAPVCGSRNTLSKACALASENLPIWAFHGDADATVPMSRTVNMVNAVNGCTPAPNPTAKITIYPGVGHSCWTFAYRTDHSMHDPNLYEWITSYINIKNKGNNIPIANAGVDRTVSVSNTISITGTATDSDGNIASYAWDQISGPSTATLLNKLTSTVTASALVTGDYLFRLKVTDNSGNTDSDYVRISVTAGVPNIAPIVNAGADQTITLPVNSTAIHGSGKDTDGKVTGFAWTKVSGGTATLSGVYASILYVTNMTAGVYVFRLTVTDNGGAKTSDDVTVTVINNIAPEANAGADKNITLPVNSVVITGTGTDSDGSIATYAWSEISGGTSTLSGVATATLTATNLLKGSYVFRLAVTDNNGATTSDDVTVTVIENVAPVANAGADRTITLPANSLTIAGSGADSDGTITAYAWTEISGSSVTLNGTTTANLAVTNMVAGMYVFRLTVTDNGGATQTDDVSVTVNNAAAKVPPVADAGANKYLTLPTNSITLFGKGTDSDGTVVSYAWRKTKGGSATLTNATSATVLITDLAPGAYYFRLTVTDNNGLTDYDDMLISITDPAVTTTSSSPQPAYVMSTVSISDETGDEVSSGLGDITTAQMENATVVIHDGTGAKIYSGTWTPDAQREVFSKEGLYIYSVMKEGKRTNTGKIYIRN